MNVRLIAKTVGVAEAKTGEELVVYVARVSNPGNQSMFETGAKLIRFLVKKSHWSPFEHCFLTFEIVTSRAIAQQILRHRSFTFQEFSQRYAQAMSCEFYEARRQDVKNRQNSIDDMSLMTKVLFKGAQVFLWTLSSFVYASFIKLGVAKEQARFLLPLGTQTTIYMSGPVRSWLHYIDLRATAGTQKEHRDIVLAIRDIFKQEYPIVAEAMWNENP